MIDIKIYMVMGQCTIEVTLSEGDGRTVEAVRWYGDLRADAPLDDLCRNITNALRSADGYAGEVTAEISA